VIVIFDMLFAECKQHRAALVEVARRAILLDDVEEDFRTMTAESLVDEYLAEQERADAAD
jgi:hypothetical protein